MTAIDIADRLAQRGAHVLASEFDALAAYRIATDMSKSGHAVTFAVNRTHDGKFIEAYLTHYLTCRAYEQKKEP